MGPSWAAATFNSLGIQCVKKKERPDRASCERFYADFGQRSGNRPAMYYDLPESAPVVEGVRLPLLLMFVLNALSFVALLLWQAWMEDYGPAPQTPPAAEQPATAGAPSGADLPAAAPETAAPDAALPEEIALVGAWVFLGGSL